MPKEYALYYGDNFIDIGSLEHIASILKVKPETVKWYTYPSWRKRHKKDSEGIFVIVV